jgi:hypothetical protein
MFSKRMALLSVALLLFALVFAGCAYNQPDCTNYALDESHKISDDAKKPHGTWGNMNSPDNNSELEQIVIDPDDPNMMDEPWRVAYYSKTENVFWIADMPGFEVNWYGPYPSKPCLS